MEFIIKKLLLILCFLGIQPYIKSQAGLSAQEQNILNDIAIIGDQTIRVMSLFTTCTDLVDLLLDQVGQKAGDNQEFLDVQLKLESIDESLDLLLMTYDDLGKRMVMMTQFTQPILIECLVKSIRTESENVKESLESHLEELKTLEAQIQAIK
jgi:hypothetical protein